MSSVFLLVLVLALLGFAGPVVAGLYLFSRLKQRDPGTSGGLTAAVIIGGVSALVLLPVLVFGGLGLFAFSSGPTSTTVQVGNGQVDPVPMPTEAPLTGTP